MFRDAIYREQNEALRVWSVGHQEEPPSPTACTHQKVWDTPIVHAAYNQLLESAPDDMSRARLLAAHMRESGAWLNVLPVSALGLRMDDDDTVRVAIGFVLELPCANPMFAITVGLKLTISAPMVSAAARIKAVTLVTQALTASSKDTFLQQESQPTLNPLADAVVWF